jgi:subtilisin family serine protease
VIVVAAAGTGAGPNYPAGYPDKLGVIGVGASDQNDAVASFSGGLPGDTDLFAPGVRIYSAYAYNGYAYGSGTSMSAPIVAAEAALMISRHPDWSYNELLQRIVSSTAPVAGASVGRINLSGALSTGLEVDHSSPNLSPLPSDAYLTPRLKLFNNTPQDIPLSSLTVRYWYTEEGTTPQTFWCDYSTPVACSNLTGTFVQIPANSANRTATSDSYLQVGFSSSAGVLPGGGVIDTYLRVFKTDISNYNELNDYSYDDPTKPDMSRWNRITIYQNGALVWGIEPNASQPTPTSPPTVVNQPTVTPLPASTNTNTAFPTMTRTGTPVPPTGTATRTSTPATRTNTPVLVTATATVTRTSAPATATASPTATMTRTSAPATATASPTATMTRTNTPVPPSVTPTSVPAATASKTPTPAAAGLACTVTYSNASDWGSGYSGNVAITNNGAAAISGWTLTWTFPGNQSITSLWGGSYTQSGTNVSITDAGYNATLAANGGSTSVGFNANYSGTNAKPATFSLNGTICQ